MGDKKAARKRSVRPQTDDATTAVNWLGPPRTLHILRRFDPRPGEPDRRGIPGRTAWTRLRELLDDARRDPEVSASSAVLSFLLVVDELVAQGRDTDGQRRSFERVIRKADRERLEAMRSDALAKRRNDSKALVNRVHAAARADTSRGRNKRIALEFKISESHVSRILKRKS